jgi:hypothetical protein
LRSLFPFPFLGFSLSPCLKRLLSLDKTALETRDKALKLTGSHELVLSTQGCQDSVPYPALLVPIPLHKLKINKGSLRSSPGNALDEHRASFANSDYSIKEKNRFTLQESRSLQNIPPAISLDIPLFCA